MKILYIAQARLGDVCCAIPTYNKLRQQYPNAYIAWQVINRYKSIIPNVDEIITTNGEFGKRGPAKNGFDWVINAQPMFRHQEWLHQHIHTIDLIARWAKVKLNPEDRFITIDSPGFNKPEDYIAVCSSPCHSSYNWGYKIRQEVIDRLKVLGYITASVGGKDSRDIGANYKFHNLSLRESVAIIKSSIGYIGPDNGTSWLACAAIGIPKLMIIHKPRLKEGLTGFENFLHKSNNIRDIFSSTQPDKITEIMESMINGN